MNFIHTVKSFLRAAALIHFRHLEVLPLNEGDSLLIMTLRYIFLTIFHPLFFEAYDVPWLHENNERQGNVISVQCFSKGCNNLLIQGLETKEFEGNGLYRTTNMKMSYDPRPILTHVEGKAYIFPKRYPYVGWAISSTLNESVGNYEKGK